MGRYESRGVLPDVAIISDVDLLIFFGTLQPCQGSEDRGLTAACPTHEDAVMSLRHFEGNVGKGKVAQLNVQFLNGYHIRLLFCPGRCRGL